MSSPKMKEFQKSLHDVIVKQISRHNSPPVSQKCISTLLQIMNNLLKEPYNEKFRKLREKNHTFNSNVLQIIGGREFLIKVGFKSNIVDFEKYFILELKGPDKSGEKISDELFLSRQLERLEIAQQLLDDYLNKVTEQAETVKRMQEREKKAEELQKAAILQSIEEDKERRHKQQEQLKFHRQLEKERQERAEQNTNLEPQSEDYEGANSFEQQIINQSEPKPFYRPYHHSHFDKEK
ncbi:14567_t:CDS:1 [Funneliformis geosporum]|uniref:13116_t:CDS:1 n=1 Tax=Funneliformis geosporum TaxID=1117311 RepID=A0A9W4WW58_9GLOM|nr:14567_t:CDS:1 [Funneliformis geosporum]CAI2168095.1 13116_t:CDS:1 [Funneliformis geosporum]